MPFKYEINGQVIEFDREPTEADIDEIAGQTQQPQQRTPDTFTTAQFPEQQLQQTRQPSPLSIYERFFLSFADDKGRENYLNKKFKFTQRLPNGKFAVGDDPNNILPIDPEGMFNDILGDLADVTAVIPPIAGQIIGGTLGIVGGPAGIIAGGGIGAAIGEAVSRGIGKVAGVDLREGYEQAVDIGLSGLFGAMGEGFGQIFKFTGRGLSKIATKHIDDILKASSNPSKGLTALAKIFRVTAAVREQDTIVAGMYGFNNTLKTPYSNPNYVRELTTKLAQGTIRRNGALGKMVGMGDDWAKANFGNKSIELRQMGINLLNKLSHSSVGMIDDVGRLNRGAFTEASDFRTIKQLTDLFFAQNPKTGQLLPRNIKLGQLIDYKKRLGTPLRAYFKSGRVNPNVERAIASYMDDIVNAISKETTTTGLTEATNPYIKANNAFRAWKQDLKLLKANGLDLEDVTDLKNYIRDIGGEKKLVSKSIFEFADKLENKNPAVQDAFNIITNQIGVKFPGGGIGGTLGTLSDELAKWNAAQGFIGANPSLLRLGAIAGLTGISLGSGDPESAFKRLSIGLLLGTPAGAKILFKTGAKIKGVATTNILKNLLKGQKINTPLLRALISQTIGERVKK